MMQVLYMSYFRTPLELRSFDIISIISNSASTVVVVCCCCWRRRRARSPPTVGRYIVRQQAGGIIGPARRSR